MLLLAEQPTSTTSNMLMHVHRKLRFFMWTFLCGAAGSIITDVNRIAIVPIAKVEQHRERNRFNEEAHRAVGKGHVGSAQVRRTEWRS